MRIALVITVVRELGDTGFAVIPSPTRDLALSI